MSPALRGVPAVAALVVGAVSGFWTSAAVLTLSRAAFRVHTCNDGAGAAIVAGIAHLAQLGGIVVGAWLASLAWSAAPRHRWTIVAVPAAAVALAYASAPIFRLLARSCMLQAAGVDR